jgi:hypothetical protein
MGWRLINAQTGQVGFSTQMSGYPTNQDLALSGGNGAATFAVSV